MGLFGALFGNYCRPIPEDPMCCSCRDEGELLTAAWRESVEQDDSALPKFSNPGGAGGGTCESPASRGVPPVLQVPPEFDLVRLDKYREAPSSDSRTPEEQQRLLQVCLRSFARALLRGIRMSVLLDDGRTLLTEASLDSELTHLVLHMPNVQCPVALRSIEKICSPDEVTAGAVLTTNQAYLDERCTTLVLRGGQFLTFVFEAFRAREYFEMCLKVVILAKGTTLGAPPAGSGESQDDPPSPTASQKSPASATPVPAQAPSPPESQCAKSDEGSGSKQPGTGGT